MSLSSELDENKQLIEHLFRRHYGKVLALFMDKFGPEHLELIEDSIQESFFRALKNWPYKGVPENPPAWLFQVTRNFMIDHFRKKQTRITENFSPDSSQTASLVALPSSFEFLDSDLKDEQLKMMFACCHPDLKPIGQVMLSLRLLCGFGVEEIAQALFKTKEAVYKTIQRAKKKFREYTSGLELPEGHSLASKRKVVQKMLYLLFNEGYNRTLGNELLDKTLCYEAIRLGELLLENPYCLHEDLYALLALMYFQSARLDGRIGANGELITLEQQKRANFDSKMIEWGWMYLGKACETGKLSSYHIEASIAKIHSTSRSYEETDWKSILDLYDFLVLMSSNPIIQLNRIVALEKVQGYEIALKELKILSLQKTLQNSYLFYAILGDLLIKDGDFPSAKVALLKAQKLTLSTVEQRYLNQRIQAIPD